MKGRARKDSKAFNRQDRKDRTRRTQRKMCLSFLASSACRFAISAV